MENGVEHPVNTVFNTEDKNLRRWIDRILSPDVSVEKNFSRLQ